MPVFARPVVQIIRARRSVRAYSGEPIPAAAYAELVAACGSLTRGPLGTECRLRLVEDAWSLWGTRLFLAGAARRGPHALEDLGRLLEELVLRATGLSLGTCWIGLGFPQRAFAAALQLAHGEILPAVIPLGLPSGRTTAYGLAARLATGAARRKSWGELFFDGGFRTPLPAPRTASGASGGSDPADPYELALEMVRLAPSAQNRQPWRVVRTGTADRPRFHFFRHRPPGLLSLRPDWQRLDIGIAMAHFELTLAEAGVHGRWAAAFDAGKPAAGRPPAASGLRAASGFRAPGGLHRIDYVASWLPEERP
jgi:nitroreductase